MAFSHSEPADQSLLPPSPHPSNTNCNGNHVHPSSLKRHSRRPVASYSLVCVVVSMMIYRHFPLLGVDANTRAVLYNDNNGNGNDGNINAAKINGRRNANNNNDNAQDVNNGQQNVDTPQQQLQSFFDNLLKLQHDHGQHVITVQDATQAYPILGTSYGVDGSMEEDCPFSYLPWKNDENDIPQTQTQQQQQKEGVDPPQRPCYTPIITIHDHVSSPQHHPLQHQEQLNAQSSLPEVLLVSGLDYSPQEMDMLGPSSIIETLRLLLECARCEALSPWVNLVNDDADTVDGNDDKMMRKGNLGDGTNNETTTKTNTSILTNAITCRQDLASRGIDDGVRKWLARLVATRRIVAVPIANVAGFYHRLVQMEESDRNTEKQNNAQSKPECDFPFPLHWRSSSGGNNDKQSSSSGTCMGTYPARIMNELFRSHAFQLGVAFHGTTIDNASWIEVPSWNNHAGNNNNNGASMTHDEQAMVDISLAYNKFASMHGNSVPYSVLTSHAADVERMHQDECKGASMEHFAFSAGMVEASSGVNNEGSLWMEQCKCGSRHGDNGDSCAYPSERTGLYDGSSLRAFVARIVAPSSKPLLLDNLPGFEPIYNPSNLRDYPHALYGPLPLGSNVRMSLLAIELVEPWTAIRSIAGVELKDDDIIPLTPRSPGACMKTRSMTMPESLLMGNTIVTWTVGGALAVAETAILYGKWSVLDKKIFDCVTQPTKQELDAFFTILRDFEVMEGETAEEMAEDVNFTPVQSGVTRWHSSGNGADSSMATMSPETTFSVSLDLGHYKVGDVIAIYSLARTDQGWVFGDSSIPAQSNFVNARTNPQWSHIHANSIDGGSLIKGRLDWFSVPVTIEVGPQPGFFQGNEPIEKSVRVSDEGYEPIDTSELNVIAYSLFMAVLVIAITVCCVFCREERDGTDMFSIWTEHRRINRQKISMDDFFRKESLELTVKTSTHLT
eukprot:CAMPEP_0172327528 /NCGR_PEP_ID=MMETSP1058-20130122/59834_1 /TAXON_ID=83371 /ORGANISM="Detonula confervacea, Strain CCMP 353" /LENGTH=954 /DNA_ID=CAMNT_0013044607 /DNA_START=137 /DNA_END=3001 /DNA_ORIENTATION=+